MEKVHWKREWVESSGCCGLPPRSVQKWRACFSAAAPAGVCVSCQPSGQSSPCCPLCGTESQPALSFYPALLLSLPSHSPWVPQSWVLMSASVLPAHEPHADGQLPWHIWKWESGGHIHNRGIIWANISQVRIWFSIYPKEWKASHHVQTFAHPCSLQH